MNYIHCVTIVWATGPTFTTAITERPQASDTWWIGEDLSMKNLAGYLETLALNTKYLAWNITAQAKAVAQVLKIQADVMDYFLDVNWPSIGLQNQDMTIVGNGFEWRIPWKGQTILLMVRRYPVTNILPLPSPEPTPV